MSHAYTFIDPERPEPPSAADQFRASVAEIRTRDLADLAEVVGETAIILHDAAGDLNRAHFRPDQPTTDAIRRAKRAVGEMLVKIGEFERDQLPTLNSCTPGA